MNKRTGSCAIASLFAASAFIAAASQRLLSPPAYCLCIEEAHDVLKSEKTKNLTLLGTKIGPLYPPHSRNEAERSQKKRLVSDLTRTLKLARDHF